MSINFIKIRKVAYLCAAGITLAACGGGGGSSPGSPPPTSVQPPPTVTSQVAQGTVTGFGSVFVNGVEWETDDCEVTIDDESSDETQLEVGDIVEVAGGVDEEGNASCDTLEYDAEVAGSIDEVGADFIVVVGIRIEVNADTVFDREIPGGDVTGLMVGDFVEVSAFDTGDSYIATRIDLETDDGEIEVHGTVHALDTDNSTFMIDELRVDYALATFEDFGEQMIANGDQVEVEGQGFNADGALIADKVEYEDNNPYDDGEEGDEFEIEGYLSIAEDGSASVNGTPIVLASDATFEQGTADDFVDGARVEVEGYLDENGSLLVDEVSFDIESSIEIKAMLDAAPGESTIVLLGIDFYVSDTTQMEDDSSADDTYFNLADLMMGDWVEIQAAQAADGTYHAMRIEKEDQQDFVSIEAEIEAVEAESLVLVGITILLNAETQLPAGLTDIAELMAALQVGDEVEVEGVVQEAEQGGVEIVASSLSLDD
ncbi:MAG: DUF5666 domain-containing protein [Pseudomonadales bacterium]